MPISPIQLYGANQQSALTQILQTGTGAIQSFLNNAIQQGRDMSNKQLAQERDLLALRQQETAMAQRRAENVNQDIEDAMRFARGTYEFDTKFGANRSDRGEDVSFRERQQEFREETAGAELDLRKEAAGRAERTLKLREDQVASDDQFYRDLLADQPAADPTLAALPGFQPSDLSRELEEAQMQKKAAEKLKDPEALKKAADDVVRIQSAIERFDTKTDEDKPLTPAEERARRKETASLKEKQREEAESEVNRTLGSGAFPSHEQRLLEEYGNKHTIPPADLKAAQSWDKNQLENEIAASQGRTRGQYIALGGTNLTTRQQEARGRFWDVYDEKDEPSAEEGPSAVDLLKGLSGS